MKIQKIFYLLMTVVLCIGLNTSCSDDDKDNPENPDNGLPAPTFTKKVSNSVYGFVTDENDAPMVGATVKAGTSTNTTDENGYFEIENAQVVDGAGVVTAEKTGYFRGIRSWITEANKKQFVRIKLLPKTIAGTFSTDAGGTISSTDGIKLNFPANSIVEEASGTEYKGTVNVALKWINPVSPYLSEMMPGDLRALNEEGLMQGLITYGMVAAELTSADGKILQMAEGKTVEMRTPIESELQASAPSEMPLWYFDEEKGFWTEEGKTVKQGNEYVGQVSHFSFWNCDVPYNFVYLKFRIMDTDGKPMANYTVSIRSNTNSYSYGYSDSEGSVSGYVPKSSDLTLYVYSAANRDCIIYSKSFSTGTSDVDLGTLTINETNVKKATIKGVAYTCSGNPVSNGYLNYAVGNSYNRTAITDGTYEFSIYFCESTATIDIKAYDAENIKMKSTQFIVTEGENLTDDIMICDDIEGNYAIVITNGETYIIDGYGYIYNSHVYNSKDEYISVRIDKDNEESGMNLDWKGGILETGEFEDINFSLYMNPRILTKSTSYDSRSFWSDSISTGKVTIMQFKKTRTEPDEYTVKGRFEIKNVVYYNHSDPSDTIPSRREVTGSFSFEDIEINSTDEVLPTKRK